MKYCFPWILGSGGKYSTIVFQIIWITLVESPKIVETVTDTLDKMERSAKKSLLPMETNLVRPILDDTFWVFCTIKHIQMVYID